MLVADVMLVMETQGRMSSITGGIFRDTDTGKTSGSSISGVESLVLGRSVKVDFNWGNNVDSESGIQADVNGIPSTPYSIRSRNWVRMLKGCA